MKTTCNDLGHSQRSSIAIASNKPHEKPSASSLHDNSTGAEESKYDDDIKEEESECQPQQNIEMGVVDEPSQALMDVSTKMQFGEKTDVGALRREN